VLLTIDSSADRHAEVTFIGEEVHSLAAVDVDIVWDASENRPNFLDAAQAAASGLTVHDVVSLEADNGNAVGHGVIVLQVWLGLLEVEKSVICWHLQRSE
jgi:hypothetical protein